MINYFYYQGKVTHLIFKIPIIMKRAGNCILLLLLFFTSLSVQSQSKDKLETI